MARSPKIEDEYSKEEADRRFADALRGARIAGHKPMKAKKVVAKKTKVKKKPSK